MFPVDFLRGFTRELSSDIASDRGFNYPKARYRFIRTSLMIHSVAQTCSLGLRFFLRSIRGADPYVGPFFVPH